MAAVERRHAAWRTEYEVLELVGSDRAGALGSRHRCREYLDAVDFALEYLAEHDPDRTGAVAGLRIERVDGSTRETIWRYDAADAARAPIDPVAVFGFDVTRSWLGPSAGRAA